MGIKLAVLLSGSGTTLQNLIDRIAAGELDAEIACVISSRAGVYGLERATQQGIPAYAFARRDYADLANFNGDIWNTVREHHAELVVLAGFMSLLQVPPDYEGRIMNVHPALIPSFCGQGMYGHHVHEAVLDYGAKVTGATVHFVDEHYDNGPIILQEPVLVENDDTADSLADRVQAKEREIYPKAIQLFADGRLKLEGRRVRILPKA
jgi:formyltetrahydrofolate-dependent phosphoribosylglycinamide formyltransferase